jgi:hypothetical protein
VRHFASTTFWQAYLVLPENIRALADKNYELLKENPRHPSLQLKKVGRFWSVRVGKGYRALAVEVETGLLWFGSARMQIMTRSSDFRFALQQAAHGRCASAIIFSVSAT